MLKRLFRDVDKIGNTEIDDEAKRWDILDKTHYKPITLFISILVFCLGVYSYTAEKNEAQRLEISQYKTDTYNFIFDPKDSTGALRERLLFLKDYLKKDDVRKQYFTEGIAQIFRSQLNFKNKRHLDFALTVWETWRTKPIFVFHNDRLYSNKGSNTQKQQSTNSCGENFYTHKSENHSFFLDANILNQKDLFADITQHLYNEWRLLLLHKTEIKKINNFLYVYPGTWESQVIFNKATFLLFHFLDEMQVRILEISEKAGDTEQFNQEYHFLRNIFISVTQKIKKVGNEYGSKTFFFTGVDKIEFFMLRCGGEKY